MLTPMLFYIMIKSFFFIYLYIFKQWEKVLFLNYLLLHEAHLVRSKPINAELAIRTWTMLRHYKCSYHCRVPCISSSTSIFESSSIMGYDL